MSLGEQLFVRGMKSDENEDMWDDSQLIKAYEKAIKSYKPVDMAQRIAMATNKKPGGSKEKVKWSVGAACRAVFEGDGEEYEAFIVDMLEDDKCLVRYVGYGDDATVRVSDLKPSHGTAARSEQVYNITSEPSWKEIMKTELGGESALDSASEAETLRSKGREQEKIEHTPRHSDSGTHKKGKNKKHKRKQNNSPGAYDAFTFPANFNAMSSYIPEFPGLACPPPLLPPGDMADEEYELLNNMLSAWYMSGYYAGKYHHACMKKKSKK